MLIKILLILKGGLIGGVIGYFTNYIALRMLFYPKRRILRIQGLLPKYKENFADKTVEFLFQFIDFDDILTEAVNKKAFSKSILKTRWGFVRKSIGFVIANEIELVLKSDLLRKYVANNLAELTPQAKIILAKKIVNTNIDNLTDMILKNTSREIRFIECLGGIAGFIIGGIGAMFSPN